MTTTHPLALNLDGDTYGALEALAANDGQSLQATVNRLLQDALRTRRIGTKPPFFAELETAPIATRRARIAAQAAKLADHFNQARSV